MPHGSHTRSKIAALAFAVGAACAALVGGCASFEHLTRAGAEFPRAEACTHCHGDIGREWAASPHARAYVDPLFRRATDDYRFRACLGCHAPQPTLTDAEPAPREAHPQDGVTCVSCHLEEGRLSGPNDPTGLVAPHPIRVAGARYRESRFCGRCHEGTFAEWSAAEMSEKPACQQCHMPAVTRKATQATGGLSEVFVSFEHAAPQKRHAFDPAPTGLKMPPVAIRVTRSAGGATVHVTNNLPHTLPTGDFGSRVVVLEASALDAGGRGSPPVRRELIKALHTAVAPLATAEWTVAIPADARAVRVRLVRVGREGGDAELAVAEVPLP